MVRQDLFSYTINNMRRGELQNELSEQLNEAVQACQLTNKMAKVTLTIDIKPNGGGTYFLVDNITAKIPKLPKNSTLMWGTPEGNLHITDPAQGELELRVVNEPPQPVKTIQQDTTPIKSVS